MRGKLWQSESSLRSHWRHFWASEVSRVMPNIPAVLDWSLAHLSRAFPGASGTLKRHKCGWRRWVDFCTAWDHDPSTCTAKEMVSFCEQFDPTSEDVADAGEGLPSLRSSLAALRRLCLPWSGRFTICMSFQVVKPKDWVGKLDRCLEVTHRGWIRERCKTGHTSQRSSTALAEVGGCSGVMPLP